jgi:hypothetical protein
VCALRAVPWVCARIVVDVVPPSCIHLANRNPGGRIHCNLYVYVHVVLGIVERWGAVGGGGRGGGVGG